MKKKEIIEQQANIIAGLLIENEKMESKIKEQQDEIAYLNRWNGINLT